jgi:hypothetical protein
MDQGEQCNKLKSKSLKCIAVGKCDQSDGLFFSHPPSKQIYTCSDGYKFDSFSPSGPQFALPFDGSFVFSTKSVMPGINRPPTQKNGKLYTSKLNQQYIACKVLSVPINNDSETYVLQAIDSGDIHETVTEDILDKDPSTNPTIITTTLPFPYLSWLKHDTEATIYLSNCMQQPKQGRTTYKNNAWSFLLGHVNMNPKLPLPNFVELAESMIHNRKPFQG